MNEFKREEFKQGSWIPFLPKDNLTTRTDEWDGTKQVGWRTERGGKGWREMDEVQGASLSFTQRFTHGLHNCLFRINSVEARDEIKETKEEAYRNKLVSNKNDKLCWKRDYHIIWLAHLATSFTITYNLGSSPSAPPMDDGIKKMWYVLYNVMLLGCQNEISPFATAWVDLEGILLRKISQIGKERGHVTSLIYGI